MLRGIIKANWDFYYLFIPLLLICGYFFPIATYVIVPAFYWHFFNGGRYTIITIASLFIFILADNINLFPVFLSLRYVVLLLITLLSFSVPKVSRTRQIILYFIPFFIYSLFISSFESPVLSESIPRVVSYLLLVLIVFAFYRNALLKSPLEFAYHFHIFFIFYATITILSYLFPWNIRLFFMGRFSGLMGNPNGLALLSAFLFVFTDFFQKNIVGRSFILSRILKLLILIMLFLAGSRNALGCVFIYLFLSFCLKPNINFGQLGLYLLVGVILLLVYDVGNLLKVEAISEIARVDSIDDASGRVDVWGLVWKEIERAPWWGKGFYYDNFFLEVYRRRFQFGDEVLARQYNGVWNSYLTLLLNVGIVGLSLLFFFIIRLHGRLSLRKVMPFTIAFFFSAFFESWLASSLNAYTQFFYFYFVLQEIDTSKINNSL